MYNWPWLYAVQVGEWNLTDAQAQKLREYLLRGGFFMCDDFWGERQWGVFQESMRPRLPGPARSGSRKYRPDFSHDLRSGRPLSGAGRALSFAPAVTAKCEGCAARWRGIYDDKGRLMVAMTFNSDMGDSWEWADDPALSREILRAGHSHRRQLRRVRDDALADVYQSCYHQISPGRPIFAERSLSCHRISPLL